MPVRDTSSSVWADRGVAVLPAVKTRTAPSLFACPKTQRAKNRGDTHRDAARSRNTAASDVVSEGWAVMPTRVIREGRDADLEQCIALAIVAAPERSASDWRDALARDIESREHQLVVAESGGVISGYGRARLFEPEPEAPVDTAPRGYYLSGVFVSPSERRTGIGAALTQARLDWISERAADAWFFANARNAASIALHERFGFEEVTRRFSYPGLRFDGGEGILFRLRFDHRTTIEVVHATRTTDHHVTGEEHPV
jgi:ribosomal protein S18 acetylase RimI-like enzyme